MMRLSSTTSVALLLALASCLSMPSVEAKAAAADIDTTSPSIRRRTIESDKKDKANDKKKEEEKPKCSVVGQPCHPSVAGMACCLDSSQAQFLQCDEKNFLCKQMKDKDIEKLLAAEAATNAGGGGVAYGVAQAPKDKKNSKQKEPSCVEAIGGWCDDISFRCCLDPSKSQFLQCKNNACARMKDKDIEKMLEGAASTPAGGGCRSDKDCCDEDKECNEVTGECFKPSCPKQCFHDDDVSIDVSNVLCDILISHLFFFVLLCVHINMSYLGTCVQILTSTSTHMYILNFNSTCTV